MISKTSLCYTLKVKDNVFIFIFLYFSGVEKEPMGVGGVLGVGERKQIGLVNGLGGISM